MENSINLAEVQGTGREGRVLKEDVILHLEGRSAAPAATPAAAAAPVKPQAAQKPPAPKPVAPVKPSVVAGRRFLASTAYCIFCLVFLYRPAGGSGFSWDAGSGINESGSKHSLL